MTLNGKILFAAIFSGLYLLFGITVIASALIFPVAEMTGPYRIPADPAAGFVLCVIGAVFASACRELFRDSPDGPAFLYIGMGLAVVFGLVAVISLGAQGIDTLIFGGGETWDPLQLAVPMLYLAAGPVIGLMVWGRRFRTGLTGA